MSRPECRVPPGSKRVLLLPLGNVLGHLTRVLALAEEFDAQGHEVHLAMSGTYRNLTEVLPRRIRVLSTPEMPPAAGGPSGSIACYEAGTASDRTNLERASALSDVEKRRRGVRLQQMLARDAAIIGEVRPDVIITDYRFTPELLPRDRTHAVFHISHLLGYPSFFRRVKGRLPFPLDAGHLLVPGIRSIEYGPRRLPPPGEPPRVSLCGLFRWRGWARLNEDLPPPPPSEVFLFFGSTGNGDAIVPQLLRHIPAPYRISGIVPDVKGGSARRAAHLAKRGDLERFLTRTEVAFCHGGHGTVMECLLHRTPMAIFPHNLEQLEIGRRIEQMRLGVLVKRPCDQIGGAELGDLIERLRTDSRLKANLGKYSRLLRRRDGAKRAVSIVLRRLAETGDHAALRVGRG